MDLEMVLNELSMRTPAVDIRIARDRMRDLTTAMAAAVREGVRPILRTHEDFQSTPLAHAYILAQWRNDPLVERDAKLFFLRLQTKAPFLLGLTDPDVVEKMGRSEFRSDNNVAVGLGVAFLTEALAVGMRSDERWEQGILVVDITTISDDGQLVAETGRVVHASTHVHVRQHHDWIRERLRSSVGSGAELWERRGQLFSSLVFTDNVRQQLQDIRPGDLILGQVVKRLLELNQYSSSWVDGAFDPNVLPSKVSPESESTIRRYGNERSFLCPDGVVRVFSLHVRLTPGAWRLHFFPDAESRRLIVGYIGPKLPTVTDPT